MRTLSKKTQYTLRALYHLAGKYRQGPVLIAHLARQESIPLKFLQQILLQLKKEGVVSSRMGRGGGYFLVRPPDEVSVGSIIRQVEGPLASLPCASETAFRKCDECTDADTCVTRIIFREVRDAAADILDRTTLADACQKRKSLQSVPSRSKPPMYHI
jgi:Rrf2 family protein